MSQDKVSDLLTEDLSQHRVTQMRQSKLQPHKDRSSDE